MEISFFIVSLAMLILSVLLFILYFKWNRPVGTMMKVGICAVLLSEMIFLVFFYFPILYGNAEYLSQPPPPDQSDMAEMADDNKNRKVSRVSFEDSYVNWTTEGTADDFFAVMGFKCGGTITEYGISCQNENGIPTPIAGPYAAGDEMLPDTYVLSLSLASMNPDNGDYFGELKFGETYYWSGYVICGEQRFDSPQYSFVFTADGTRFCDNNRDEYELLISEMKSGKIDAILPADSWGYGSLFVDNGLDMDGNVTHFRINLFDNDGKLMESLDGNYNEGGNAVIVHIAMYTSDWEYIDYWYEANGEMAYYVVNELDGEGNVIDAVFYDEDGIPLNTQNEASDIAEADSSAVTSMPAPVQNYSVAFTELDAKWYQWFFGYDLFTLSCVVEINQGQRGNVGFKLWDGKGNEVFSRDGLGNDNTVQFSSGARITRDYAHITDSTPLNGTIKLGETYHWIAFVTINGQRYESQVQSFVFSLKGSRLDRDTYDRDAYSVRFYNLSSFWRFGSFSLGFNAQLSKEPDFFDDSYSSGITCWDQSGNLVGDFNLTSTYYDVETGENHLGTGGDRLGGSVDLYEENDMEVLIPGQVYTWVAYVVIKGNRYESPKQSFVFTLE